MKSAKPVIPRETALRDVEAAVGYYAVEAGADVAIRFIDALQAAYLAVGQRPGTGSPRYAQELDLPDLRYRKLARYPYLVFYIEQVDHIDVWRVLHAQRDIPNSLQDQDFLNENL